MVRLWLHCLTANSQSMLNDVTRRRVLQRLHMWPSLAPSRQGDHSANTHRKGNRAKIARRRRHRRFRKSRTRQILPTQNGEHTSADAALIKRASRFPKKLLRREAGASQHAIDRFFRGERIHPSTRKKLARTLEKLERGGQWAQPWLWAVPKPGTRCSNVNGFFS